MSIQRLCYNEDMLNINFIRDNKDLVQAAATRKSVSVDIDALLALDVERRELVTQIEELRAEQNQQSERIQNLSEGEKENAISAMKELKNKIQELEKKLDPILEKYKEMMLAVPNIPDVSVPDGDSDLENEEIKSWGKKTEFDFNPRSHIEILEALGMVDFGRGSKVHGFRGYFLLGDAVKLSFAIWNYASDFFSDKGYMPVIAPAIVRKENLYTTGHLPNEADDVYYTQDNDYLVGTAEVPLMGYYANEILDVQELPKKFLGFTPCYRREAGSYGKDTKGLVRVHEFYKWEQLVLCTASHEESVKFHEEVNRNTEEFIESLEIPYRTVINCTGDLGLGQVKKYDIELWVPGEQKYREISSASYFHDFQTRRANIRYRDAAGKIHFVHSLNCTAVATPRIMVSMIENFQNPDGSVNIPHSLIPYFNSDKLKMK